MQWFTLCKLIPGGVSIVKLHECKGDATLLFMLTYSDYINGTFPQ